MILRCWPGCIAIVSHVGQIGQNAGLLVRVTEFVGDHPAFVNVHDLWRVESLGSDLVCVDDDLRPMSPCNSALGRDVWLTPLPPEEVVLDYDRPRLQFRKP